jgi:uncharacterized protein YegL
MSKKNNNSMTDIIMKDFLDRDPETYVSVREDSRSGWELSLPEGTPYSAYFMSDQSSEGLIKRSYEHAKDMITAMDCPFKVNIMLSPTDSKTVGRTVWVATQVFTDNDLTNGQKADVFTGLAIHEGSHLLYTDFGRMKRTREIIHHLWNIIEDERIERKLGQEKPGLVNFIKMAKYYMFGMYGQQQDKLYSHRKLPTVVRLLNCILALVRYPKAMNPKEIEEFQETLMQVRGILTPFPSSTSAALTAAERIYEAIRQRYVEEEEQKMKDEKKARQDSRQQQDDQSQESSGSSSSSASQQQQDKTEQEGQESHEDAESSQNDKDNGSSGEQTDNKDSQSKDSGSADRKDSREEESGSDNTSDSEPSQDDGSSQEENPSEESANDGSQEEDDSQEDADGDGDASSKSNKNDESSEAEDTTQNGDSSDDPDNDSSQEENNSQEDADGDGDEEASGKDDPQGEDAELSDQEKEQALRQAENRLEQDMPEAEQLLSCLSDDPSEDMPTIGPEDVCPELRTDDYTLARECQGELERGTLPDSLIIRQQDNETLYRKSLERVRRYIPAMRKAVEINGTDTRFDLRGMRSGRLDTVKIAEAIQGCPTVYIRQMEVKAKKTAAVVLIDESGSMGGEPLQAARDTAVLINEALSSVPNLELYIYGYSTSWTHNELYVYREKGFNSRYSLGSLSYRGYTPTGMAIQECTARVRKMTDRDAVLFIISDGMPDNGPDSVAQAVAMADNRRFHTIGISINPSLPESEMKRMYRHYVNHHQIASLAPELGKVIKKTMIGKGTRTTTI